MKISTDKLTTYAGLATGILSVLGQSGAFGQTTSQVLMSGSAFAVAVLGFYSNKAKV